MDGAEHRVKLLRELAVRFDKAKQDLETYWGKVMRRNQELVEEGDFQPDRPRQRNKRAREASASEQRSSRAKAAKGSRFVQCPQCGNGVLPHLLEEHKQRSCKARPRASDLHGHVQHRVKQILPEGTLTMQRKLADRQPRDALRALEAAAAIGTLAAAEAEVAAEAEAATEAVAATGAVAAAEGEAVAEGDMAASVAHNEAAWIQEGNSLFN